VLATAMGRHGQRAVIERFNWPQVVARVEAAYDAARSPSYSTSASG